jgi:hypothetical protein
MLVSCLAYSSALNFVQLVAHCYIELDILAPKRISFSILIITFSVKIRNEEMKYPEEGAFPEFLHPSFAT